MVTLLNVIRLVVTVVAVAKLLCVGVFGYANVSCEFIVPVTADPHHMVVADSVAVNIALPLPLTEIVGVLVYPYPAEIIL